MHLSQAWLLVPGLARGDLSDFHAVVPSSASGPDGSVIRDMWDLDDPSSFAVKFLRYYRQVAGSGTMDPSLIEVA